MSPITLEEMAWSFAVGVCRREPYLESRADEEFRWLVPKARDRRAAVAIALLHGWVRTDEMEACRRGPAMGEVFYTVGPAYHLAKRDRFERVHGIGRAPREDWDDGSPRRRQPAS